MNFDFLAIGGLGVSVFDARYVDALELEIECGRCDGRKFLIRGCLLFVIRKECV